LSVGPAVEKSDLVNFKNVLHSIPAAAVSKLSDCNVVNLPEF